MAGAVQIHDFSVHRARRLGKAALAQERVGARQPAAKGLVGVGRLARAAG
jgi:hypothetical protein